MSADIRARIAQHRAERTLIGFHCEDGKADTFFAGYVEDIEKNRFLIRYVNRDGIPGSGDMETAWFDFEEIVWITSETPYLRGLAKLYLVHSQFVGKRAGRWIKSSAGMMKAIKQCLVSGGACRITFGEGEKEFALIESLSRDFVLLGLLGDDGSRQGSELVRLDAITGVQLGVEAEAMTYLVKGETL